LAGSAEEQGRFCHNLYRSWLIEEDSAEERDGRAKIWDLLFR